MTKCEKRFLAFSMVMGGVLFVSIKTLSFKLMSGLPRESFIVILRRMMMQARKSRFAVEGLAAPPARRQTNEINE